MRRGQSARTKRVSETSSKSLPPDLVEPFAAAISVSTRHAPPLEQAVLADFITGGHFGRHIRRMREIYARRHSVLLAGAKAELAGLLDVCSIEAGLQTVGWLPAGVDGSRVAARAAERGVEVKAIPPNGSGRRVQHVLQLGFAAVDAPELRRGIRVLAEAVREVMARSANVPQRPTTTSRRTRSLPAARRRTK